jgi:hypothetical protein
MSVFRSDAAVLVASRDPGAKFVHCCSQAQSLSLRTLALVSTCSAQPTESLCPDKKEQLPLRL